MTALTAAKATTKRKHNIVRIGLAADAKIYLGAMVCLNNSGTFAVQASDTVGLTSVIGIAVAADPGDAAAGVVDNTGGANNAKFVMVESDIAVKMTAVSITQSMVRTKMYVVDDATVDDTAGSTNKVIAGSLIEFISTTEGWIYIPPFGTGAQNKPNFVSAEQTGTGSSQNVAHNLGVIPAHVAVIVTELPDAAAETGFDVAQGAHTSTNVVVTVTNTVKFQVLAWT